MQLNNALTNKAAPTSQPNAVNSPEFCKGIVDELKDWVKKGHCKLAPGNEILWTPEELAAMTPEERARCAPSRPAE
jgi:hypothetical protein